LCDLRSFSRSALFKHNRSGSSTYFLRRDVKKVSFFWLATVFFSDFDFSWSCLLLDFIFFVVSRPREPLRSRAHAQVLLSAAQARVRHLALCLAQSGTGLVCSTPAGATRLLATFSVYARSASGLRLIPVSLSFFLRTTRSIGPVISGSQRFSSACVKVLSSRFCARPAASAPGCLLCSGCLVSP
jgi:hypothetical protein